MNTEFKKCSEIELMLEGESKLLKDEFGDSLGQFQSDKKTKLSEKTLKDYLNHVPNIKGSHKFLYLSGLIKNLENAKFNKGSHEMFPENETKYLDLKIGRITWEGHDAMIVIISENLAAQKLHYFQEQIRYKDNLLATVSHDLRTPLNGVIGILDQVLENIFERNLRKA